MTNTMVRPLKCTFPQAGSWKAFVFDFPFWGFAAKQAKIFLRRLKQRPEDMTSEYAEQCKQISDVLGRECGMKPLPIVSNDDFLALLWIVNRYGYSAEEFLMGLEERFGKPLPEIDYKKATVGDFIATISASTQELIR